MPRGNPAWKKGGPSPNPTGGRRQDAAPGIAVTAALARGRHDGYVNATTGLGMSGRDKTLGTVFCPDIVDDETALQIYRGDPLAARMVDMPVDDALREPIELCIGDYEAPEYHKPEPAPAMPAAPGKKPARTDAYKRFGKDSWERRMVRAVGRQRRRADAADSKGLSEEIEQALGENGIGAAEAIAQAIKYSRAYRGGAILIGANDYATDLSTPLELERVRSLDYLTVMEARELTAVYYYDDPFAKNFRKPAVYRITPTRTGAGIAGVSTAVAEVHESRLIIFDGTRVSSRQMSGSAGGWGDSIFTRILRALVAFHTAHQNVEVLLADFAQAVYRIKGLAGALAQNPNALMDALLAIDLGRSMVRAVVIDEGEEFERKSTQLTGYPEMIDRLALNVSAACGIPMTRLMGQSASGLNATGEGDDRFYYDGVSSIQTKRVAPAYMRLVEIELAIRGQLDVTHSLEFAPLWQPTDKEKAETRKIVAETDAIYINSGVVSAEEIALSRFGGDAWSMETHVDFEARAQQMSVLAPAVSAHLPPEEDPNAPEDAKPEAP